VIPVMVTCHPLAMRGVLARLAGALKQAAGFATLALAAGWTRTLHRDLGKIGAKTLAASEHADSSTCRHGVTGR
jgi:hypothetical protein